MMEGCERDVSHIQCQSCDPHGYRLLSRLQKMANGSLLITDVTTDDTGKYTCVAGNSCSIKYRAVQLYVVGERPPASSSTHTQQRLLHQRQWRSFQAKDEDVH